MSKIQDIYALQERIYEAVEEYIHNAKAYTNPLLRIYLDDETNEYLAEVDDFPTGTKADHDKGLYDVLDEDFIEFTESYEAPNNDYISEIANTWLFLD